jgi:hypothetical protein
MQILPASGLFGVDGSSLLCRQHGPAERLDEAPARLPLSDPSGGFAEGGRETRTSGPTRDATRELVDPPAPSRAECYSIGEPGDVPDLAVQVVWTGGGLDKLDIYRLLGVREVWVWQKGRITISALRGDQYLRIERSGILPQVDIELLEALLELPTQTAAVRELRARLRSRA